MIKPDSIPLFTGDLGQLEQHTDALRKEADGIRQAGGEAHRQFQGLSAFYQAPEAEDLFASTKPVSDAADRFGDKVATVADALRTYAAEVAPIAKRLEQLQSQAATFVAGLRTDDGAFDENWTDDADKVSKHQALMHDVHVAQEQFAAAEIACNNKITALVGGTQYVMNTGAKQLIPRGAQLYGYSAEVLDQAKQLPWGTPVTQTHDWWDPDDLGYYAKSFFWDGIIVDNVWGTIDGLATLAGFHGSDRAGQAWEGLVRAIVGAETYLMESGGQKPTGVFATDFAQDSKGYAKEFAKGFVAWDMWEENPSRAAATVVFNGLTLGVGPLKAASAGKAGAAAKTAATVAKAGEIIDPLSAAAKVTGHAIPRIAQVTQNLRGVNNTPALHTPHSVLEFSDATGRSVLIVEDGRFLVLKDGKVVTDTPLRERSLAADAKPGQAAMQDRELASVGAASRAPEASAGYGDSHPPGARHERPVGGSGGSTPHGAGETSHSSEVPHAGDSGASAPEAGTVGTGHTDGGPGGLAGVGPDDLARSGGSGGTSAPDNAVSAQGPDVPARPSFMRDGDNPYGPRGSLTPRQIMEIQVYRANHEPGYLKQYYYEKDGRRLDVDLPDESGFPPPQLVKDPKNPRVWISKGDSPAPLPPKYVPGGDVTRGPGTVTTPEAARTLADAAQRRHGSVTADTPWHDRIKEVKARYKLAATPENLEALNKVKADHAPFHNRMRLDAEAYGEAIAKHHVIPEHYPGATWEKLDGPKNGNDQFDQLWRRKDGGFVVVEAKSNVGTEIGKRDLPNGVSVAQGSKEYFLDILNEMQKRGLNGNRNEAKLYKELKTALKQGKVDYILVKGRSNGGEYAGYYMRRFDLG
ncbi:hypothetical protein [Streptomyces sp. NPDC007984]|uniref:hypothetical protein n=1 Tax=Streptomyces sp. NPDC007984 TaxID=3364801 RepID=UPI0036E6A422